MNHCTDLLARRLGRDLRKETLGRRLCVWFLSVNCLIAVSFDNAEVALPDFGILGRKWDSAGSLWKKGDVAVFPRQLAIDFNDRGTIYGLVCDYGDNHEIFDKLKTKVQQELQTKPKIAKRDIYSWRNEDQKVTVTLFRERGSKIVKLSAVSIDSAVRESKR
jgi:hypothetical protein